MPARLLPGPGPSRLAILGVVFAFSSGSALLADGPAGEAIYREKCASCHGPSGEGTAKEYPHPLAGDRSVPQLSKLIARTMPSDDPGSLSADGFPEGRGLHLRRLLFAHRAGADQADASRPLAAHRPPVPQRGGRPGRVVPALAARRSEPSEG